MKKHLFGGTTLNVLITFLALLFSVCVLGQETKSIDLSGINFNNTEGNSVVYPNSQYYSNYSNQSKFVIYPDYHLTPEWCKAGAYFKYNGADCNAEAVKISVYLPMSGNNWGYREHNENNVRDPDWSGWWNEPYDNGYFIYTVKAKYGGVWYETGYYVTPSSIWGTLNIIISGAKVIMKFTK